MSPSAVSWVAESTPAHAVVLDDRVIATDAIQPCWLDEDTLVYADTRGARVWQISRTGAVQQQWATPAPVNRLEANGHGSWLGWMPERREYVHWTGSALKTFSDAAGAACLEPNGQPWIAPSDCIEARSTEGGRCAIDHLYRPPRIYPVSWAHWDPVPVTHLATPLWTPEGPWILRLEDTRLVCHPDGDPWGYVVAEGDTYEPDAAWMPSQGRIRVVWRDVAGTVLSRYVTLSDLPRTDLREPTPPPVDPPLPPVEPPLMPDYKHFSWDTCHIHRDVPDIGAWPITSRITAAAVRDGAVILDHTQAGRWPVVPYEDIDVEGCVWTIAPEGLGWRAATWDRLRPGQTGKEMGATEYQQAYALDLPGWVPRAGEIVGYFVSTPARMDERGPVNERSGIVWVTFGTDEIVAREEGTGIPPPVDPPQPPVTPPSSDLSALEARVAALELWTVHCKAWAYGFPEPRKR